MALGLSSLCASVSAFLNAIQFHTNSRTVHAFASSKTSSGKNLQNLEKSFSNGSQRRRRRVPRAGCVGRMRLHRKCTGETCAEFCLFLVCFVEWLNLTNSRTQRRNPIRSLMGFNAGSLVDRQTVHGQLHACQLENLGMTRERVNRSETSPGKPAGQAQKQTQNAQKTGT